MIKNTAARRCLMNRTRAGRITSTYAFACSRGYPYLDSSGGQMRDGIFMNRFWFHDRVKDRRDMRKVLFVGYDAKGKQFVHFEEETWTKAKPSGNPRFGTQEMSPPNGGTENGRREAE